MRSIAQNARSIAVPFLDIVLDADPLKTLSGYGDVASSAISFCCVVMAASFFF
jgi:hypothetical protein